jgi:hypothetical protein
LLKLSHSANLVTVSCSRILTGCASVLITH